MPPTGPAAVSRMNPAMATASRTAKISSNLLPVSR